MVNKKVDAKIKKTAVVIDNSQRLFGTLGVVIQSVNWVKKYKRSLTNSTKIMVHFDVEKFKDVINNSDFLLNKTVTIESCSPISKRKSFRMVV